MCDSADASYVQKLGYLTLENDTSDRRVLGSRPEAQVPRSFASKSFMEPSSDTCRSVVPSVDCKMYERENIIAASRFATPKAVDQINSQQHHVQNRQNNQQAPVYENIEYYPQQPQTYPPYYHPVESRKSPRNSPRGSLAGEAYDGGFRKAQPQVPAGNRYQSSSPAKELPPYEAPPVYENIQEVHFGDPNQTRPGPQVPANYYPASINGGDYVVMTGKTQGQRNSSQGLGTSYTLSQRARGQSYDGSNSQRSGCSENPPCMRYFAGNNSSFVDSQSGRNAYVPPSELLANRNYSYQTDQQQQQQHSPRSSLPYHSESPPIRLPPEPHQYHRGSLADNSTNQTYRQSQLDSSNQQGQFRQDSSQSYKYAEPGTRNSNSSYHGDPPPRHSPGYGPSNRSGEVTNSRNSQCYSPIRGSMTQNERNYHAQVIII